MPLKTDVCNAFWAQHNRDWKTYLDENGFVIFKHVLNWVKLSKISLAIESLEPSPYARETLSDGRVIYSKGNDHFIDAVRYAMLVREEASRNNLQDDEDVITPRVRPVWTNTVFW